LAMASSIRSILVLERVASAMTTVLNESTKLLWAEQFLGIRGRGLLQKNKIRENEILFLLEFALHEFVIYR